jgi:hypothetical protein
MESVNQVGSDTDPVGAKEQVEGLDEAGGSGWGDYPLDSVFVRTETRTVGEVVKRIENARYILDPDFQRDFVWPAPKQSKLIESCVMRIPLPVFYVAEARDGRIVVVDGLQRLTTFARFVSNQLKLVGLVSGEDGTSSHALEGKHFRDLPLNLQERVQDTQLTMYILDAKAPERARLDIFERVNSGEPLTRQQMRNALYNGAATEWLKQAAQSDAFRSATGQSLSSKTMRDREAINRFVAFRLIGWQRYKTSDMDSFLADGLKQLAQLQPAERDDLLSNFESSMRVNKALFGDHAFRKSLAHESKFVSRSVINISLFEVCAATMSHFPEADALNVRDELRAAIADLVGNDAEFQRAITYSTNSTLAVHRRFLAMEKTISGVVAT